MAAGAYRYFAYPLPDRGRRAARRPLSAAGPHRQSLGRGPRRPACRYPERPRRFPRPLSRRRPAPPDAALLRYETGDWNALHQDLYGEHVFPLQVAILLSAPGADFTGGELVLAEQRPRMQSRAEVVPLGQGDAVIFPVRERPVRGSRGWHRRAMRHGVSRVRSGLRFTLGLIFHDAL